jgi:hypothetical protein
MYIPEELQLVIVEFLNVEEMIYLSRTCRHFNMINRDIRYWRHFIPFIEDKSILSSCFTSLSFIECIKKLARELIISFYGKTQLIWEMIKLLQIIRETDSHLRRLYLFNILLEHKFHIRRLIKACTKRREPYRTDRSYRHYERSDMHENIHTALSILEALLCGIIKKKKYHPVYIHIMHDLFSISKLKMHDSYSFDDMVKDVEESK